MPSAPGSAGCVVVPQGSSSTSIGPISLDVNVAVAYGGQVIRLSIMQFRLISKGINSNGINNYATINSHATAKIRKSNTEFNRVLVLKDHPSSNGREIKVVR